MIGRSLGPYEITEALGAGGMGEVWAAQDTRLGRRVAVKVLPEEFAGDPERLARFEQEARAAAALNHPHIAAVFDVGVEGEGDATTHFMVQELLEGESMRDFLGRGRPELGKALDLCIEIAEALSAAHGAGIIHRDLKPENIFVSRDGHAKVLDFGLAKLTELAAIASPGGATRSPTMIGTVAGQVMGTAGYMAPEQVAGGDVDHRADLFAFGVLLYELSAGQQPFAGENVIDTLHKITNREPVQLGALDGSLPADLARIIDKALAKNPAARYQSAADVAVDLRNLAADVEADRAVSIVDAGKAAPAAVHGAPYWMLAAGVVVALAFGLTMGALWLAPAPEPGPVRVFDIDYEEGQRYPTCCSRNVALSPDGSLLAYAAQADGARQIFLRRMGQYAPVALGAIGQSPSFSPDGEWVVYSGTVNEERGIFKLALAGGDPFRLTSVENAGFDPEWSDDGWIYFQRNGQIRRVPATGGEIETLEVPGIEGSGFQAAGPETVGPRETLLRATPLPGGQALLLQIMADRAMTDSSIGLWSIGSEEVVELAAEGTDPRYSPTGHVLYVRGDTLYALPFELGSLQATGTAVPVVQGIQVDPSGAAQMALAADGTLAWQPGTASTGRGFVRPQRLDLLDAEGDAAPLSARIESYSSPALSPDQTRLAVEVADAGEELVFEIWILEIAQDALARLSFGGGRYPVWSRDGDWVYFARGSGIWRQAADFSAEAELVVEAEDGTLRPRSISPGGQALLYEVLPPRRFNANAIALLDLESGDGETLIENEEYSYGSPQFSPEGEHFVYWSSESGTRQVYVREVGGTRRWLVSPGEGYSPHWSTDGSRIFYTSETGITTAALTIGDTVTVAPPREFLTPESSYVPRVFGVTPDDRLLMMQNAASGNADSPVPTRINVVLNWFDELRRLAPPER